MSEPELEFHLPDGQWSAPVGAGPGVEERVLADDPEITYPEPGRR
ncbi:hypothetical protein ABT174_20740 [Streptomyces sparsogenes]